MFKFVFKWFLVNVTMGIVGAMPKMVTNVLNDNNLCLWSNMMEGFCAVVRSGTVWKEDRVKLSMLGRPIASLKSSIN